MLRINGGALIGANLCMLLTAMAWAEPKTAADAGIAAYVGGKAITMADLDAKAFKTNMKLAQSLYDARQEALDGIILERSLAEEAAAQKLTVDQLIDKRVAEKAKPVTDADVEAFFNARRSQMRGRSLEDTSGQIRQYLEKQRQDEARRDLLSEVKKKSDIRITLAPPRAEVVVAADEAAMGPIDAKVTIVEYADFQ